MSVELTNEQKAQEVEARLIGIGDHSARILDVRITAGVELKLQHTDMFAEIHGVGDLVHFRNGKYGYISQMREGWFFVRRMSNGEWLHDSAVIGDLVIFFHSATDKSDHSGKRHTIAGK